MKPNHFIITIFLLVFLLIPLVSAADEQFKPYLHKANIPQHPGVKPYGTYATSLFPGAGTYTYPLVVPQGTNNLQPTFSLAYNNQQAKSLPGMVGSGGWSLTANYIYRDVNATLNAVANDEFHLVFNGNDQQLVQLADGTWRTEIDSFQRIERLTGGSGNQYNQYWLVTDKGGTQYRFGYGATSEMVTTTNNAYAVKWYLDMAQDLSGNNITYSYLENPFSNDISATYPDSVTYNRDNARQIYFMYDNATRPDGRLVYEQGSRVNVTRRLSSMHVYAHGGLVRRYALDYLTLAPPISVIANISLFGADNISKLHTVSFSYRLQDTGYQNYTGQWIAPELFTDLNESDRGVRLADLNNDGFIDLIQGRQSTSQKRAWINAKNGNWVEDAAWAPPIYIVDQRSNDTGVFFVDLDADGKVDILQSGDNEANTVQSAWLNTGSGWTNGTATWRSPVFFVANANSKGAEVVDLNGDSRPDIFLRNVDDNYVYLNNGSGWIDANATWKAPTEMSISGGDRGVRLVDLNGDGLVDYVQSTSRSPETKQVWLNNQSGWNTTPLWEIPIYFADTERSDTGVRFFDVNGDGLSDMFHEWLNGSLMNQSAWLNTGFNWTQNNTWRSPTPFTFNGRNLGRRIGDVNGDGLPDIIVSYEDASGVSKFTNVKEGTAPYVLQGIRTEYGGNITIGYNTSTIFNHTGADLISDLGFAMWIVNSVTQNNSLSNAFHINSTTSYNYTGGSYDYGDGEFRGFQRVDEFRPDNATVRHFFHQDDGRKGKEYRTEMVNVTGQPFQITNVTFSNTFSSGYWNVLPINESSALYDGTATNPKVTNTSYSYDTYGNLIEKVSYGDDSVNGDEKREVFTYALNTTAWIVSKPSRYQLFDRTTGTKVRETTYVYDNTSVGGIPLKGELTHTKPWLNGSAVQPITSVVYNSFGNVKTETNPLGATTKYTYDNTSTYPQQIINPLDQPTTYQYDLATGNLLLEETNDIPKYYTYDTFGRPTREIFPYDSSDFPTKNYTYSFDGTAPESIKISTRESSNKTSDVYFFYDGLGNLIQIKSPAENNQQVIKNIYYDQSGRVADEDNVYFDTFSASLATPSTVVNETRYVYDPLSRITYVRNPDNTNKTIIYNHGTISDYDENGYRTDYVLDAYDQIAKVVEFNHNPLTDVDEQYNTSYSYDTAGSLVKIVDTLGNNFNFTYDTLGRKTTLGDPDLGHWEYQFDVAGNLIGQNDSKNNNIDLAYDARNRVINKNSSALSITFGYDRDYFGTLANITAGSNYTFTYTYDDRLRLIKEIQTVDGQTMETAFAYDSLNRKVSENALSVDVDYLYNKQGKLNAIPGFISSLTYNAFGSPLTRNYNNSKSTSFTYDTNTNRIANLTTDTIQQLHYTYDKAGNILTLEDDARNLSYRMRYDQLDRLINTTINNDPYKYTYNPIGNLLKLQRKNNTTHYTYQNLAHAPSQIDTGWEGVQVYNIQNLTSGSRNVSYSFWLINEMNTSLSNVPWTVDWGDGTQSSGTVLAITDNVTVNVTRNYASGGNYLMNVSATANGYRDSEWQFLRFGIRTHNISITSQNTSNANVQFIIKNDRREDISGINWNCNGAGGGPLTLTGNSSTTVSTLLNVTAPGSLLTNCTVTSTSDGNESALRTINVPALAIENYNLTSFGTNHRRVQFTITNSYSTLTANWKLATDEQQLNGSVALTTGQSVFVEQNLTYSTEGLKEMQINVSASGTLYDRLTDNFEVNSLEILDYAYHNATPTTGVFTFFATNDWPSSLNTSWSVSDPSISSIYGATLPQNTSVFVAVEDAPASKKFPLLRVSSGNFIDTLRDIFTIRPVAISRLLTLHEGNSKGVTEVLARNHTGTGPLSWQLNTSTEVITSNQPLPANVNETFIFIEHTYSAGGVYQTKAEVNSSTRSDNATGVVIT